MSLFCVDFDIEYTNGDYICNIAYPSYPKGVRPKITHYFPTERSLNDWTESIFGLIYQIPSKNRGYIHGTMDKWIAEERKASSNGFAVGSNKHIHFFHIP